MMRKGLTAVMLAVLNVAAVWAAAPVEVELVTVRKIWDGAPHNAFTDLVWWRGGFYCAFREGRGHVSTDGRIRVLRSSDARQWTSAHVARLDGFDLRDAHLSVTPDDRLMLIGGAAPRKTDHTSAPTGSFVAFSADGKRLFVGMSQSVKGILVVDCRTHEVVSNIAFEPGHIRHRWADPVGLARYGERMVVAVRNRDELAILDEAGKVVAAMPLGMVREGPIKVLVLGDTAFVSHPGHGAVALVDLRDVLRQGTR